MRLGIMASAFDPLHPGHVWAMEQAIHAGLCESIVAAVHIDPSLHNPSKHKPVLSVKERRILLSAIRYVYYVTGYDTEQQMIDLMKIYDVSVRIIGEDHRNDMNTGDNLGIPVFFAKRCPEWSSREFIKRFQQCQLPS